MGCSPISLIINYRDYLYNLGMSDEALMLLNILMTIFNELYRGFEGSPVLLGFVNGRARRAVRLFGIWFGKIYMQIN